jgi:hypothetical protein
MNHHSVIKPKGPMDLLLKVLYYLLSSTCNILSDKVPYSFTNMFEDILDV